MPRCKRTVICGTLLVTFLLAMTGCKAKEKQVEATPTPVDHSFSNANAELVQKRYEELVATTAVTLNGEPVTMEKAMLLIYQMEARGNYYASYQEAEGGGDFWQEEVEDTGKTMSEHIKDQTMEALIQYGIFYDLAVQNQMTLSKEDIQAVDETILEMERKLLAEEVERGGFTTKSLTDTAKWMKLAEKYYLKMSDTFTASREEVKKKVNREEYKEYKTEYLYYPTTYYDADYELVEDTDEHKEIATKRMQELYELARAGESMDALLAAESKLTRNTRTFLANSEGAEAAYKEAAAQLKNGEFSKPVQTEYGIYLIYMLDNDCTDTYEAKIDALCESERAEAFAAAYEVLRAGYTIEINETAWKEIILGATVSLLE